VGHRDAAFVHDCALSSTPQAPPLRLLAKNNAMLRRVVRKTRRAFRGVVMAQAEGETRMLGLKDNPLSEFLVMVKRKITDLPTAHFVESGHLPTCGAVVEGPNDILRQLNLE